MINNACLRETGITPLVHSYHSHYTILNLIEIICEKKICAIEDWLNEVSIRPKRCLIIGSYLTGVRLAQYLCNTCLVTVLDVCQEMQAFMDPRIIFTNCYEDTLRNYYDCIIDTSGLGGIQAEKIAEYIPPDIFLVEDPCSDKSDPCIYDANALYAIFSALNAQKKGILRTGGLGTKTSGTMTLALDVIRNGMTEALNEIGVLYSSSHLDFFERMIFKEKDPEKFFTSLLKSGLCLIIK